MAPGSARGWPSAYTCRWAWMWYASCSTGAHWMPSTVAPWVVLEAGPSSGPASSGIPSGPSDGLEDCAVVVECGVVIVAVLFAAALWVLVLLLALLPQPASAQAMIRDSTQQR